MSSKDKIKQSGFEVRLDGKVEIKFPDGIFTCVEIWPLNIFDCFLLIIYNFWSSFNFNKIYLITK
ncbi:MAG: hypothetical protein ACRC5R_05240, partial [Mycoplasmatales bacterium]